MLRFDSVLLAKAALPPSSVPKQKMNEATPVVELYSYVNNAVLNAINISDLHFPILLLQISSQLAVGQSLTL